MPASVALLFGPLLLGVLLNGVFGARFSRRLSGWIGCLAVGLAFVGALLAYAGVRSRELTHAWLYTWIAAGDLRVDLAFRFDPLSAVMALVVTGVSLLIHVYSNGYMHRERPRGFSRYFAYLNLFVFAMLVLVLADNYLLMFVGWEGVGLCSYLLIGFWYDRGPREEGGTFPSQAAKKAFVVNRIGDFGFLLGMLLLFVNAGTLDFDGVYAAAEGMSGAALTVITLLLFAGAVGKSAQIPLYVWLPDAMQGPTPVSALIHAATMVTAGVYMVARSHVLYALAGTGEVVAWIGVVTALFAATMALATFDIKAVLAYSTISQLGYMFVGVGLGAYSAGIAHLMTHAFFKGLLFLGAGSALHAMRDELDIRKMGGLSKKMPLTFWTFLIAACAIAGVPFLSGFFSKDAILVAAWQHPPIFWIGLATAALTAFYMFRLVAVAFLGEPRDYSLYVHVHESPPAMTLPLLALAVLSAGGGLVWLGFHESGRFYGFLAEVFHGEGHAGGAGLPFVLTAALWVLGPAFALFGVRAYVGRSAEALSQANAVVRVLRRKYYVDELYDVIVVRPVRWVSDRVLWRVVDVGIIDGLVNFAASVFWVGGSALRMWQTGSVQTYAIAILAGLVALLMGVLAL